MATRRANDLATAAQQLDALATGIRDLSPAYPELGRWFADRQQAAFDSAGFGKWSALDPETIRRRGGSTAPLIATGALRAAASSPVPVKQSQRFVVFGIGPGEAQAYKARFQVSRRKAAKNRRDPVPNVTAADRRAVAEIVAKYLGEEYRDGA